MKKYLSLLALFGAALTVGIPQAMAETHAGPAKAVKKAPKKAAEAKPADDDNQPDMAGHNRTDYSCEMGNKVTVYEKADDNKHIGLRWNRKMHELTRVSTSTGADRFENKDAGLVWINIPAKAMLLDSKKGQQLANECRHPGQTRARKSI
ncbi:MAG: hypothetical protein V7642_3958 [Burkholderiales bacterium]|jgi:hypothetical protein